MYNCQAIFSDKRCDHCGSRAVLWSCLNVRTLKSTDFWKCACDKQYPLKWSKRKRGRK